MIGGIALCALGIISGSEAKIGASQLGFLPELRMAIAKRKVTALKVSGRIKLLPSG